MSIAGIGFSSTISLGVILITLVGAALAIWRTQSIAALRQAGDDLRKDRDDWKMRAEDQKVENDRQAQKIVELTAKIAEQDVAIARLEERTDTSLLAKEAVVSAFREEMRGAVARIEGQDAQKLELLQEQSGMIKVLISRDPSLRTRAGDPHTEGTHANP